jgi:hypothetical protein
MALAALATPTVVLGDPQLKVIVTNVPGTTGTALAGNTGFTVPWVPGLMIQIYNGATPSGVVTFLGTGLTPNVTFTLSNASSNILYGPISSNFANASGLVQVNVTTVTTTIVNAFLLPQATGTSHNPFNVQPQLTDF